MSNRIRISNIVFSVYILLTFYVLGGGIVNSLVSYRTWRAVGEKEFPGFHQIDSALIIPLFVIFFFLSFIPQLLLFWFRPVVIPKALVWAALLCNLITLISTITIQIPIQQVLDERFSLELINRLISTDMIYRRIPMLLMAVVNFIMLYKVVANSNSNSKIYYEHEPDKKLQHKQGT
ncbi:MAG TPA: hypothetical protein VK666_08850 [Chryseolinea sp.]|nr:hypothetical protein [Chryseolinea sp.]